MQCRDDPAGDEVPRKMTPRLILPGQGETLPSTCINEGFKSMTPTARGDTSTQFTSRTFAPGANKTRSQMDRSSQPRCPQPDKSAWLDRPPTRPDRLSTWPAPVQASTSQHTPRDAKQRNGLYQKASSISASSVGKEEMTHPFEHSPQERNVRETNALYQNFAANYGAREEVSMSRYAERDGCTNSMHRGATAMFAANLGPEVRRSQSAARDFRDDVS